LTRVAFVAPLHFGSHAYVGGGERYPLNLARGIVAADPGVHVHLIAVGERPHVVSLQPRLHVHVLPMTLAGVNDFDHASSSLGDVLEDVDIVHVHQAFTRPSQLAILVGKLLGKPIVVTDHGALTNRVQDTVPYLELVDLFVFQSRFAARQITAGSRRAVIPGGVDSRFFRPPRDAVEREFVLFVGRLLPHKGIDRLLCALPREVPCVVAGRAYDDGYARYVRAIAAGRDVTFVEDADDFTLRDLYRRAWATVLPSVHRDAWGSVYRAPELMGLTALESMSCGTPAIVSSTAALPEFVHDGSTGFVFEGLAELAERALALSKGDLDSDELGRNARASVESDYSLDVVGERLWRAYLDVWQRETSCAS
jgi:glycosyltransferase involved in cell wall biosynthesis